MVDPHGRRPLGLDGGRDGRVRARLQGRIRHEVAGGAHPVHPCRAELSHRRHRLDPLQAGEGHGRIGGQLQAEREVRCTGQRELDPVIPQVLIHRLADRDRLHHVVGWAHGLARRLDGVAHRLRQVREQQPGGAADALALDLGDLDRTPGEVDDAASGGRVAQDRVGTVRHLHVAEARRTGARRRRQEAAHPDSRRLRRRTRCRPRARRRWSRTARGLGMAQHRPDRHPHDEQPEQGPGHETAHAPNCAAPGATAPGGVPARHRPGRPAGPRASRGTAAPSRARGGRGRSTPPAGRT